MFSGDCQWCGHRACQDPVSLVPLLMALQLDKMLLLLPPPPLSLGVLFFFWYVPRFLVFCFLDLATPQYFIFYGYWEECCFPDLYLSLSFVYRKATNYFFELVLNSGTLLKVISAIQVPCRILGFAYVYYHIIYNNDVLNFYFLVCILWVSSANLLCKVQFINIIS